jgi:hypothetical protein
LDSKPRHDVPLMTSLQQATDHGFLFVKVTFVMFLPGYPLKSCLSK